jgi:hypothetical protein
MPRMLEQTRRQVIATLYAMLLVTFTLQATGCTVVGLGIGAIVDSKQPDHEDEVPPSEWRRLEPGQDVLVRRDDIAGIEKYSLVGVAEPDSVPSGFASADGGESYPPTLLLVRNDVRSRNSLSRRSVPGAPPADTVLLQPRQISAMYRPRHRSGVLVGGLIGLAIDVVVAVSLAQAFEGGFGFSK